VVVNKNQSGSSVLAAEKNAKIITRVNVYKEENLFFPLFFVSLFIIFNKWKKNVQSVKK
jgi:hypothetical protein